MIRPCIYSNDPPVHANTMIQICADINGEYFMNAYVDVNFTCNGNIIALLYALINISHAHV